MSHFLVFVKKELVEYVRTYKLLILLVVFIIFGIMNPLVAKLTPELLTSFMPEGMFVTIPEPTALDSWAQFFKNTQQMGLIVLLLVFSGVLGTELTKGTLINLLTKGLSRQAVVLAKYTAMVLVWTLSVVVSAMLTWIYTVYLFPDGPMGYLFVAIFCMWLFGVFLLVLLLASATMVRGNYGGLLLTGLALVILMVVNIFPEAHTFNPLSLGAKNMSLVSGTVDPSSLYAAMVVSTLAICGLLFLSVLVFQKKEL